MRELPAGPDNTLGDKNRPDSYPIISIDDDDTDAKTTDFEGSDREANLREVFCVKFVCPHKGCLLQFTRQDKLDRHEHSHTGVRKHTCAVEDCRKQYICMSHLKRHMRSAHLRPNKDDNTRIACPIPECGKTFTNRTSMLRHKRDQHLNAKSHRCEHCDETFHRKDQLRRHITNRHATSDRAIVVHAKRQHHCGQCSLVFDKWTDMVAHRRSDHHWKCTYCSRSFVTLGGRKAHMAIHDASGPVFECEEDGCPKFYATPKSLKAHIRSKHGSRFTCDMCGKTLSTKQKLIDHLAWHVRCADGKREFKPKIGDERKPRKDKGVSKLSMATQLTNVCEIPVTTANRAGSTDNAKSDVMERMAEHNGQMLTRIDDTCGTDSIIVSHTEQDDNDDEEVAEIFQQCIAGFDTDEDN